MRRIPLLLCVVVLLLAPARVAAQEHGAEAPEAEATHGHEGPHRNLWLPFLIQVVGFVLLAAILRKYAWPSIRNTLDRHTETVTKGWEDMEAARKDASTQLSDYRARLARMAEKARQCMDQAVRQGEPQHAQMLEEARKQAADLEERLRVEIGREEKSAVEGIRQAVARKALDLAAAKAAQDRTPERQDALVNAFLAHIEALPAQAAPPEEGPR